MADDTKSWRFWTMTTYKDAGVDIDAGNNAVDLIRQHIESTYGNARGKLLSGLGGFSSLLELPKGHRVAGTTTDGVGTKVLLASLLGKHDTIGIDLVAMCANDLLASGLHPWQFLDYLAMDKQIPERTEQIVSGIAKGCHQAGMVIAGGEMAEMPDLYPVGYYDLAGFAVGTARSRKGFFTGRKIRPGMNVYGLRSSGVHSNGFSLVRRVFDIRRDDPEDARRKLKRRYPELKCTLAKELLRPTRIYAKELERIRGICGIAGLVHITGGGLIENPPRVLPDGCAVLLFLKAWKMMPIFQLIQRKGRVSLVEMLRTFNMGIGMLVITPDEISDDAIRVGQVAESESKQTQFVGGQDLVVPLNDLKLE